MTPAENEPDLAWLADRFVLGDLDASEEEVVLARLDTDERLAEAVARSSRLVVALETTARPPVRRQRTWPRAAAALAAIAATVGIAAWFVLPDRGTTLPAPQDVIAVWRQAADADWTDADADAEDEPSEADAVPDWLLAAVALDAGPRADPETQEN